MYKGGGSKCYTNLGTGVIQFKVLTTLPDL